MTASPDSGRNAISLVKQKSPVWVAFEVIHCNQFPTNFIPRSRVCQTFLSRVKHFYVVSDFFIRR